MSYPLSCNGIIYFVIKSQKYIHIKKKKNSSNIHKNLMFYTHFK